MYMPQSQINMLKLFSGNVSLSHGSFGLIASQHSPMAKAKCSPLKREYGCSMGSELELEQGQGFRDRDVVWGRGYG